MVSHQIDTPPDRPEYIRLPMPSSRFPNDPEKAQGTPGWPRASLARKSVKFKIQTTAVFKPKDYEIIQAIVGLWRKVGIEAEIESLRDRQHS